jgi:hypothetical protein
MRAISLKVVTLAIALVGPWAGVLGTSSLAAAGGATTKTRCSGLTANVNGKLGKLTGCTATTTGGSGVIQLKGKHNTDLITWINGGTTTVTFNNAKLITPNVCSSGFTEYLSSGKVKVSTGPAVGITGGVSGLFCTPISGHGKGFLLPGALFTF